MFSTIRRLTLFGALSIAGASGCSDTGPETVIGRWILQTIDGRPLPQPFNATTTIHSDEYIITADGSFEQFRIRTANNNPNTPSLQECFGTWSLNGDQIAFSATTGCTQDAFTATWSGRELRRLKDGVQWNYRKE